MATKKKTPATTAPAPAGFNLTDWITGGTEHRLTRTALLALDANDAERIAELEATIERLSGPEGAAPAGTEALGEVSNADKLTEAQDELEHLLGTVQTAEVVVYGLVDTESERIREEYKAAGGTDEGIKNDDVRLWYRILAEAATLEGHRLTPTEWEGVHETIGGQFVRVIGAYVEAANAAVGFEVSPHFRS